MSYSQELATNLSNQFRAILSSPFYRELFPAVRIGPYKNTEAETELIRRGPPLTQILSPKFHTRRHAT